MFWAGPRQTRRSPSAAKRPGSSRTGIFVRDNVPLQMGENRITVVATGRDGQKTEQVITVNRAAETPAPPEPKERPLEIDEESIEPAQNVILSRGDVLQLSFRGTPGQSAEYSLSADNWQPMTEALDDAAASLPASTEPRS